jgi:iron complex outermembrane recepter protein
MVQGSHRRPVVLQSMFLVGALSIAAFADAASPATPVKSTGGGARPVTVAQNPPATGAPAASPAQTPTPTVPDTAAAPPAPPPPPPAPVTVTPAPPASTPPPSPENAAAPVSNGAGTPPAEAPVSDGYLNQLGGGDVVKVTIDRRSKSLQDLSGSAEAFSEADLERKGVTSVRELTAASPYIEIGTQEGNIELYMRGIGNSNNTEIGDPAAAFHIDGIYIPRPRGLGSMFYDLERVEISRGPQGTLRGRNATAGTMNIISAQPKLGEWGANGSLQLGNYAQRLTKTMVNIPLGDTLAIRFATFDEKRNPFYKNENGTSNLRAPEDADTFAYRASIKWAPSSRLSVIVRADNTMERGTGWTGSNVTEPLQNGILPSEIPNVRSIGLVGVQPAQSLDHWGVNATINAVLGPVNLEVLNSYRYLKYTQTTGTSNGVNYNGKLPGDLDRYTSSYWDTRSKSVVNEIRLYSPDSSRFRWTVGGFNLYESQFVFLGQATDKGFGYAGAEYNHPDVVDGAVAGFADGTFDILDRLRVLGGIRVTHDYKHRNGIGYGFNYGCIAAGQPGYDPACVSGQNRFGTEGFRFAGAARTNYSATGSVNDFLNGISQFGARDTLAQTLAQPGARVPQVVEQHGHTSSTFVDFRVGGEHNLTPHNLLYATFSTGHKAGGFNDTLTINGQTTAPEFGPESVYASEVGSKNQFFDKKITLNAAAFWYAYNDYQSSAIESFGPGVDAFRTTVRKNTGDARILGLDVEANAHLPKGFTGHLAGALLDARFLGFKVVDTRVSFTPADQPIVDLGGKFLPRAPVLAVSYGIEQTINTSVGFFDWSLSGQTKAKMYMTQFNGDGKDLAGNVNPLFSDVIPWTTRVDASVGYLRPKGDIHLEAFVANFTNMTYMTSILNAPQLNLRFYNPPRQFGVRLSFFL